LAAAGLHLRRGQGDADAGGPGAADGVEQRTPPAAEVEHAPPRLEPDLLRHVLVLAPLGLLEVSEKSPSYFAPLKSASSPRLSRMTLSVSV